MDPAAQQGMSLTQLVIRAWGWATLALLASVSVIGVGVFAYLHDYVKPTRKLTPTEELLPLIVAGVVWFVLVTAIVLACIWWGRRKDIQRGDLLPLDIVSGFFGVLSVGLVIWLHGHGTIMSGILTFVDGCLLVFCLMYIAIACGVRVPIPRRAWTMPSVILLSTMANWL